MAEPQVFAFVIRSIRESSSDLVRLTMNDVLSCRHWCDNSGILYMGSYEVTGCGGSKKGCLIALKSFFELCKKKDAVPCVYYSGHGSPFTGNWRVNGDDISFDDIVTCSEKHPSKWVETIICDCCFSGIWVNHSINKEKFNVFAASGSYETAEGRGFSLLCFSGHTSFLDWLNNQHAVRSEFDGLNWVKKDYSHLTLKNPCITIPIRRKPITDGSLQYLTVTNHSDINENDVPSRSTSENDKAEHHIDFEYEASFVYIYNGSLTEAAVNQQFNKPVTKKRRRQQIHDWLDTESVISDHTSSHDFTKISCDAASQNTLFYHPPSGQKDGSVHTIGALNPEDTTPVTESAKLDRIHEWLPQAQSCSSPDQERHRDHPPLEPESTQPNKKQKMMGCLIC